MKVLDLTQYEAGTTCSQYLAWFGADVVKIEPPGRGDPGRHTTGYGEDSLYFLSFNHNKRSLAIDLASEAGRDLFLRLVPRFDVVVENFTLGTMEKLGLGYDVLKAANPAIIYATIKGFGATGPYAHFKCFDWIAQAAGGSYGITGEMDGPPMRPGASVADTGTGMHTAMGILAAYIQRQRTGEGQIVEVSMQETIANFMRMQMSTRERVGDPVPRRGNQVMAPSGLYPCAPGGPYDYLYMMIVTTRMWDSLVAALDRPDLALDPRFATPQDRMQHGDALHAEIAAWTSRRTKFEAMEYLAERGVPCSAVYSTLDVLEDKHLNARGIIRTIHHPIKGDIKMQAPPIHMSASRVELQPAPLLGQHTEDVLRAELALTASEVEELARQGLLQSAALPVAAHGG
jgi:formyl-CoA transferase